MNHERTALMRTQPAAGRPSLRGGFTLTELLVVITIIGIIIAFLLNAAMDGIRRAEERATQSLIAKLEGGLNDRLDALLQNLPTPNYAHGYLAGVYPQGLVDAYGLQLMLPAALQPTGGLPSPMCNTTQRAQAIATFDYIKAELPDVFFLDPQFVSNPQSYSGSYPIRFTGLPYPGTPVATGANYMNYILPLGHMVEGPLNALPTTSTNPLYWVPGYGDSHLDSTTGYLISTHPELGATGSGIYGASYAAAAGLYKNLGYGPEGYDMIDNNGDGLVDDYQEGLINANQAQIIANLQAHTHNTARAEMLYAVLVEGLGPLGSVFSRDDFTDKEVKDTDGDGLPEFVDAWGQPLQFFRWPLLYHSDIQRGQAFASTSGQTWSLLSPYSGPLDQREQDPLDVNQQLVAPAWWSTTGTGGLSANGGVTPFSVSPAVAVPATANVSAGAQLFSTFFHRLVEPLGLAGNGVDWDRSGTSYRRAFFTKFLVLSGGPDQLPGVFLYNDSDINSLASASVDSASAHLIANENSAMPFGWASAGTPYVDFIQSATIGSTSINSSTSGNPAYPANFDVFQAAQDDITNQNLQATGGIGGSG